MESKNQIKSAIQTFSSGNFTSNALSLFQALGYVTERQAPLHKKTKEEFRDTFISSDKRFDETKARFAEWKYVDLLFQLSKEEVLKHTSLFDIKKVDSTIIETYLFFAIELERTPSPSGRAGEGLYSRTELSLITREVNRLFPMPVMILFRHGSTLTLSVINRRLHKRDESKDVLEKVTQIKDINIANPHRAHIEILFDLSFDELKRKHPFSNFVELHNAWQKTLDTKELNKKFFNELANWYFWAANKVAFPDDEIEDKEIRNATGVIRLITRLMFVWFLKEKNLVPEDLFDERKLKTLLKYTDKNNSTYYKAILQNLFFATLNTEMGKRKFRSAADKSQSSHYFIHNLFRYENEFHKPKETLEKLFDPIPFLNGGLFECLDKQIEKNGKLKAIRIDGFSDREDNVLKVPNELFFSEKEKTIDLSKVYGMPKKSKEKVRGLIDILSSYKFTITENTPIEEEVALDPELLGKVFENLLANYNPETQTTARKQTGSFYTPREIVNYMVDESLLAYLKNSFSLMPKASNVYSNESSDKYATPSGSNKTDDNVAINISSLRDEERLKDLLSYSDKAPDFFDKEKNILIDAIDNIKILDPACGSGAFPMGILHKLVHTLHKLDPKNELWKQRQIAKASAIDDAPSREAAIATIEEAFENNELDYGRKLYLIENCIYGVDIQPIAVQISKLRFFISLIVDQKNKYNYQQLQQSEKSGNLWQSAIQTNMGIRPLPNLETKFVAANTLIALEKENDNLFTNPEIDKKKEQLKKIRHDYFQARTPKRKANCREKDKQLRDELAQLLVTNHDLQPATAKKIVAWNPYDQNASASFFDMEWMFGLKDGFDVVIGNPPYVNTKRGIDISEKEYYKRRYKSASGQFDIFCLFIENALHLGKIVSYIVPKPIINNENYLVCRKLILENGLSNVVIGSDIFESAGVESCIFVCNKINADSISILQYQEGEFIFKWNTDKVVSKELPFEMINTELSVEQLKVVRQIRSNHKTFEKTLSVTRGIESGKNDDCITERKTKYKLLRGEDVTRYNSKFENLYVNYDDTDLSKFKPLSIYQGDKILIRRVGNELVATLDSGNYLTLNTIYNCKAFDNEVNLYCLLGIINSTLIKNWFKKVFVLTDKLFPYVRVSQLNFIPIKLSIEFEKPIECFVKCVLFIKKQNKDSSFFERLIDAMVYELYLPEAIQNANCEVLKHLNNLPELKEGEDEKNLKTIEKIFKELSDPKHPVSVAMQKMQEVEDVKIIAGRK